MKETPEKLLNRNGLRYSAAGKLKAVKLYLEEGYQVKGMAQELGIGKSSLRKWIREYREKGSAAESERRSPNELWDTDVMYFRHANHEKIFS